MGAAGRISFSCTLTTVPSARRTDSASCKTSDFAWRSLRTRLGSFLTFSARYHSDVTFQPPRLPQQPCCRSVRPRLLRLGTPPKTDHPYPSQYNYLLFLVLNPQPPTVSPAGHARFVRNVTHKRSPSSPEKPAFDAGRDIYNPALISSPLLTPALKQPRRL